MAAAVKRLLLSLDAEQDQPWLVDAAAQLAQQMGAEIHVLTVDEVESQRFEPLPRSEYLARAEHAAKAALERLARAGVHANSEVRAGTALETILAVADEYEVSLIVLGGSPRGPLAQRVLGSVPLEVVQHATRPVVVVTAPDGG